SRQTPFNARPVMPSPRPAFLAPAFALLASVAPLTAQTTLYWNINGYGEGASYGNTAAGTWDAGASDNWGTRSDGYEAPGFWVNGSNAVFSAGANATGSYTVTMGLGVEVPSIQFQEGTVELYGGSIYGLSSVEVFGGATATINSSLHESGSTINFTKTGAGVLNLITDGINLHLNGTTTVAGGTFNIGNFTQLGAGDVTVSNGATLHTTSYNYIDDRTVTVTGTGSTHSTEGNIAIAK